MGPPRSPCASWPPVDGPDTLFAWDSGLGPESAGSPPELVLSLGPPPPTPPPLPTKPFLVATLTPVPQNVLTVVAQAHTATAVAETTGTYTPIPYQVYTPTPFPANLETVQAVAVARGLPPVLLATPIAGQRGHRRRAEPSMPPPWRSPLAPSRPCLGVFVTPIVIAPRRRPKTWPPPPPVVLAATATAEAAAGATAAHGHPHALALQRGDRASMSTPRPRPRTWPPPSPSTGLLPRTTLVTTGTPTPLPWNALIITAVPTPFIMPPHVDAPPALHPRRRLHATPTPTETGTPPAELPPEVRGASSSSPTAAAARPSTCSTRRRVR